MRFSNHELFVSFSHGHIHAAGSMPIKHIISIRNRLMLDVIGFIVFPHIDNPVSILQTNVGAIISKDTTYDALQRCLR
jgi:hypothetical protein